jgi:[ribosomal protein S18]-alanine N-acetyltransferase
MPDLPMKPEFASPPRPTARQVRKFESRHATGVAKILRQSPEAAEWSLKSIEQLDQRGEIGWVVDSDGAVSGFLVARAVVSEAEILNLCVDPEKRRTGNAAALLQAAIAELQRLRVETVFLEVRASNQPALSFYEKHGFAPNGRRPAYYQNPTEDAVLMMRELTG